MRRPAPSALPPGPHGRPVVWVCHGCRREQASYLGTLPRGWRADPETWAVWCRRCLERSATYAGRLPRGWRREGGAGALTPEDLRIGHTYWGNFDDNKYHELLVLPSGTEDMAALSTKVMAYHGLI